MDISGLDVDIVTGEPVFAVKNKREEKRNERIVSEYQTLVNDLSNNGGAVLKRIAGLYSNRINEIIKTDPTCMAYQVIFDDLKIKVNIGKKLTNIKINELEEAQRQSL